MKLEVGMYVRTKEGLIFKIEKILNRKDHILLFYDFKTKVIWDTDEIKAGFEPIDVIKVGDYVNGYKVKDIDYAFDNIARYVPYIDCNKNNYIDDIKSIVTKEKFKSMEYKVGE